MHRNEFLWKSLINNLSSEEKRKGGGIYFSWKVEHLLEPARTNEKKEALWVKLEWSIPETYNDGAYTKPINRLCIGGIMRIAAYIVKGVIFSFVTRASVYFWIFRNDGTKKLCDFGNAGLIRDKSGFSTIAIKSVCSKNDTLNSRVRLDSERFDDRKQRVDSYRWTRKPPRYWFLPPRALRVSLMIIPGFWNRIALHRKAITRGVKIFGGA